MYKQPVLALALAALATLLSTPLQAAADAQALVRKADQARGGDLTTGLAMQSTITSFKKGEQLRSYSVQIEGQDGNSLVTFTEPAHSRGQRMLMRQRNMWFLSTDTKKPVPISPRQRLLGDAANGDLATANFARDYAPKITGEAKVGEEVCDIIELTAKTQEVSYDKIVYYIARSNGLGLKAEYFASSGRMLKIALMKYDNKIKVGNKELVFISEMEIQDAVSQENKTVLSYAKPEPKNIPASRFDLQSLLSN